MKKRAVPFIGRRVEADGAEIDRCKEMISALEITERDLALLRAELAEAKRTGSITGLSLHSRHAVIRQDIEKLHSLARGLSL
jgi:hypothetical protein